ncbi:MAG: 2-isopropylmalate synthase [Chitinispirillales bacterium]|nr:2-isopropylmalate synthase [Chitinispirillales bacterium]
MKKEKVIIFDTTLRDGEQAAPSSLSVEQKLRIAKQLAHLKVDFIEAGFPISSPGDFESVSTIAREVKGVGICGLARAVEKDIVACAKAVKPAERPRVHIFLGTSGIHIEKKLRKSEDQVLSLIRDSVKTARKLCNDVEFSAEDAGRTDKDFLCKVVETAIKAGASTINIPDTVGYTLPEQFGSIIKMLFERVSIINDKNVVLSVHCHNDLGMSTANSLTAVAHGARQVECTVNGIGERAGNAALEEIVMAIKLRSDFLKTYTDINTREIMRTSKLVREICNMPVQPNKAIVGSNAFAHSSGIHQDGVLKAKNTYEIMTPQSIGLKDNRMNLTSRSGSNMVKTRLADLGYAEGTYDMESIYARFKMLADKKGTIYDDDLVALVETRDGDGEDFEDKYVLRYLNVSSGVGTVPTAAVRIAVDGKSDKPAVACAYGAFEATMKAIDKIIAKDGIDKIEIDDFSLASITEGRKALAKVTIRASAAEGSFVGSGVDIDIVQASANAYMNVVNKIARMKKFNRRVPLADGRKKSYIGELMDKFGVD